MQYLQLTLGFTTKDNATLLLIVAACGLVIKVRGLDPAAHIHASRARRQH